MTSDKVLEGELLLNTILIDSKINEEHAKGPGLRTIWE